MTPSQRAAICDRLEEIQATTDRWVAEPGMPGESVSTLMMRTQDQERFTQMASYVSFLSSALRTIMPNADQDDLHWSSRHDS